MKILMFALFFWPSQIKEHLAKGQRMLAGDGMSQVTKTLLDLTQRKNFYAGDLLMSVEILRNVTDTFKRASYIPASDGVQVREISSWRKGLVEMQSIFGPTKPVQPSWRRTGGRECSSKLCLVWALEMTSVPLVILHLNVLAHKMHILHLTEILNENLYEVLWAPR